MRIVCSQSLITDLLSPHFRRIFLFRPGPCWTPKRKWGTTWYIPGYCIHLCITSSFIPCHLPVCTNNMHPPSNSRPSKRAQATTRP